jgi:ABC-type branched-subunit amino acid transport system substrate-binding protein
MELQVDWGKECGDHIRAIAKPRGYTIVADQKYAPPTRDFASLILDLKSAGADVVFSVPTPPQSMVIVKQMKELNYAPKVTLFIRGPDLSTYGDAMGKTQTIISGRVGWHALS